MGLPLKMSCLLYPSLLVRVAATFETLSKGRRPIVNYNFTKKTNATLKHTVCSLCST